MKKTKLIKMFILSDSESKLYFLKNVIKENLEFLNKLQSDKIKFIFPVKAFPHKDILTLANDYLCGFDISNQNEYKLIKSFDSNIIWNSSPFPLTNFTNNKIIHDLNSDFDLKYMQNKFQNCSIRLNTNNVNKKLSHTSRFGINSDNISKFKSIHYHSGTEKNQIDTYLSMIEEVNSLNPENLEFLNLGGGFTHLSKEEISRLAQEIEKLDLGFSVIFEPGRWITNKSGIALGKVKNYTFNSDKHYLITTLSRDCHLRWLTNINISFHKGLNKEEQIANSKEYIVTGPTCYEGDIITSISFSEEISLNYNDIIMISNVSGYSYAWNTSFNGINKIEVELLD